MMILKRVFAIALLFVISVAHASATAITRVDPVYVEQEDGVVSTLGGYVFSITNDYGQTAFDGFTMVENVSDEPIRFGNVQMCVVTGRNTIIDVVQAAIIQPGVVPPDGFAMFGVSEIRDYALPDGAEYALVYDAVLDTKKTAWRAFDAQIEPYTGSTAVKIIADIDDLSPGMYEAILCAFDDAGRLVFADNRDFNTEYTEKLSVSIEDREVELLRSSGLMPVQALAVIYEK